MAPRDVDAVRDGTATPGRRQRSAGASGPIAAHALLSAFEEAPIGMAVLTPQGVVSHHNAALRDLVRRPSEELTGRTFFEITHPEDLPAARENCARMQSGLARVVRHECRFLLPDGTELWVVVSTSRPADVPGHPPHLIMHVEEITERKALEAELTRRALHDALTGLPNRTLLLDRITHALVRSTRTTTSHCLFYLDLNGFKAVNDAHGHAVGDQLLQGFADRLTALLRTGDTAARLGGDEFAVLCEDTDAQQAGVICDRLQAAAATPFTIAGRVLALSAAIGLSTATVPLRQHEPARTAEELLSRADLDMYRSKRSGPAAAS